MDDRSGEHFLGKNKGKDRRWASGIRRLGIIQKTEKNAPVFVSFNPS